MKWRKKNMSKRYNSKKKCNLILLFDKLTVERAKDKSKDHHMNL